MLIPAYVKIKNWVSLNIDNTNKTITLVVNSNLRPLFHEDSVVYLYLVNHPPIRLFVNSVGYNSSNWSITFTFTENVSVFEPTILYFLVERKSVRYSGSVSAEVSNYITETETGLQYLSLVPGVYNVRKRLNSLNILNTFILIENILVSNTSSVAAGTYNFNLDRNFVFVKVSVVRQPSTSSSFYIVSLQHSTDGGTTWITLRNQSAFLPPSGSSPLPPVVTIISLTSPLNTNLNTLSNNIFRVSVTLNQATFSTGTAPSFYVSQFVMPYQNTKFNFNL